MRRFRRVWTSVILMLAMAWPLAGQVTPDSCTDACHSAAMQDWDLVYDSLIAAGEDPDSASTQATAFASGTFWRCMYLLCRPV